MWTDVLQVDGCALAGMLGRVMCGLLSRGSCTALILQRMRYVRTVSMAVSNLPEVVLTEAIESTYRHDEHATVHTGQGSIRSAHQGPQ